MKLKKFNEGIFFFSELEQPVIEFVIGDTGGLKMDNEF